MVRLETLMKVAVYGAAISVSGSMLIYHRIQDGLASGGYYKKSLEALKHDKEAVAFLGPPLRPTYLNLGRNDNRVTAERAELYIPIRGRNNKGNLHTICNRSKENEWQLEQLELEVNEHRIPIILEQNSTEQEDESIT